MLAGAIHREYFLLQCLKKEIATTKELDLRQLGKVIIFRDRQTNKTFLLYIDHPHHHQQYEANCGHRKVVCSGTQHPPQLQQATIIILYFPEE